MADQFDADAAVGAYLGDKAPGEPVAPPNMQASMALAVGTNPDAQAEAQRVARRTGVPVDTVLAQPQEMKNKAALGEINFDEYAKLNPIAAAVLSDPEVAKVAHDDINNMGALEGAFKKLKNAGTALAIGAGPMLAEGVYGTLETGSALASKYIENPINEVVGLPLAYPFGSAAEDFRNLRQGAIGQQQQLQQSFGKPGFVEQGIYSGLESVGLMAPSLLLSVATGSPTPALVTGGVTQGGQSAGKALDAGLGPEQAALYGGADAAIEVGTEALPVAKLIGDLHAGSSFLKILAHQAATEIPGELVATTLQNLDEWAVLHPEKPFKEYLSALPEDLAQTLIATMTAVGVTAGAAHGANRIAQRGDQVKLAEQNGQVAEELNTVAAESKLRTRDPVAFQQFMGKVAEQGPVQDFYIDPKALAQAGITPEQLVAAVPVVAQQLDTVAAGGDIKIPVADYATQLAGTDLGQALIDHIKTDPNGMSRAEAQAFTGSKEDEALRQQVESKLSEELQNDQTFKASRQVVQDDILKQLTEANRFTADVNAPYSALLSNFYAVQAARLGVTPEELYRQQPVNIRAENVAGRRFSQLLDKVKGLFGEKQTEPDMSRVLNQSKRPPLENLRRVPMTLRGFIRKNGGIKDIGGDLTSMGVRENSKFKGVINNKNGLHPDHMRELALEAGFLAGDNADAPAGSTINDLFDAISRELGGTDVHSAADMGIVEHETQRLLARENLDAESRAIDDVKAHAETLGYELDDIDALEVAKLLNDGYTIHDAIDDTVERRALMEEVNQRHELGEHSEFEDEIPFNESTPAGSIDQQLEGADQFQADRTGQESKPPARAPKSGKNTRSPGSEGITADQRGSFSPDTNTISLFKAADLSTFLHESGHFFLETLNKLAQQENAPQEIKDDMQTTLKWLGVKDLAEWNSKTLDEQRDAHEQFAQGFEAYLFEGKSPSVDMQGIFQRFRAWLLNVYRSVKNLNVTLDPDIRQVFDRMLASSEQIRNSEAAADYLPVFVSAEDAGMTPEEFKAYYDLGTQATQEAITELERRSLRDMRWASNAKSKAIKRLQNEVEEKRKVIRNEVIDQVMKEPVNQARTFLKRGVEPTTGEKIEGAHRLDIDAMQQLYGEAADAPWRQLESKYGKYGVLGKEGIHPDVAAEMFGFSSGDELVQALINEPDAKMKIAALTDQRMLEKYGDLTDPARIEEAAHAAIHNETRTRFIATEANALQKAAGGKKIFTEAAKRYAETMIARLKERELSPARYAAAEIRAARAAEKARVKGDIVTAAAEKRNQLIQNYATRAAYNAREQIDKGLRYLGKFSREGSRKKIDVDYLDQIDALLERFDLRRGVTLKEIDKRKSLLDWVKSQEEQGLEPEIDPAILNEANRKSYKEMTVEEMRGLVDTVEQIEHLGRWKDKMLTARDNRTFKVTANGLADSIRENAGDKRADNRTRPTTGNRIARLFKGYLASHRKIASLTKELDGFKDGGYMWEIFTRSMNDSGNKEALMREDAATKLSEPVVPILKGEKMGGKGKFFKSIGRSLNREERITIALNRGNAGNLQRLLDGEGWTHEQLAPVLDSLTKEELDFAQRIWDFFESYRPEIAAKERRLYGKEPEWIEPTPFMTPHGEYRGGYYPVKYDARLSAAAEQHADAELAKQQMKGAYTSATTRRSFTKPRADEVKGRPLLLTMDGLYQGVNEVIHDLAWHEWLIDANRLIRNKAVNNAIRSRYGADVVEQFKKAITDIAGGEMPGNDALEKTIANLRGGAVIAGLAFNILNTMVNVTGITQSFVRIGPRWVLQGLGEWAISPVGLVQQVFDKSEMMRLRAKTQQREINEIRSLIHGKSKLRNIVERAMFAPVTMTQMAIDMPTWWGAYQKALAEDSDEGRAVALADQAVIDAQGGGQVKDLAAIQRGNAYKKLLTTFYGFFSTTYNLTVESTKRTNFRDPAQVLKLGSDYLMLYTVPALLGTLLKGALTGGGSDWEDPEKLIKMFINDQISYAMGTIVGLREITGAVEKAVGVQQYNSSYGGPAGLRFLQEIDRLGELAGKGELNRALLRSGVNVAGILLHLPSTQINRTIDGIAAISEGRTRNPLAVLTGGPKK